MARTRTGSFPIGFRRTGAWQKDLAVMIRFAKDNGFECVDVGALPVAELKQITDAGLKLGTVDLPKGAQLGSPDAGKRQAAADEAATYMRSAMAVGARNFFTVAIGEDQSRPRRENHGYYVDGYGKLCGALKGTEARIVIEGWPGGQNACALACTPESYRALIKDVGSPILGINFDPSHLIRMGIDHVRFAKEFAPHIFHMHGKDTELLDDNLYEYGRLQASVFEKPFFCGEWVWRYCIPGHGAARWGKLFNILKDAGYKGMISIELEDQSFNGTEEGEKRGLIAGRDYLMNA